MSAARPENEAIFHAARAIPDPDRRREYVRQACGGDETWAAGRPKQKSRYAGTAG
jgi:hypothetical protein